MYLVFPDDASTLPKNTQGAISAALLYPVDVMIKRLQLTRTTDQQHSVVSEHEQQQTLLITPSLDNTRKNVYRFIQMVLRRLERTAYCGWHCDYDYFNGIDIAVLQSAIEKYIYVVAYTALKQYHNQTFRRHCQNDYSHDNHNTGSSGIHDNSCGTCGSSNMAMMMIHIFYGYMAQWIHLPITIPLETWKSQLQIQTLRDGRDIKTATNLKWDILYRMIYPQSHHDPKGMKFPMNMYSGISSYLITSWKPAIQYTIYESIKRMRIQHRRRRIGTTGYGTNHHPNSSSSTNSNSLAWIESFVIAIVARTIATIIIYPYVRRRLLQLQSQQNRNNNLPVVSTTTSVQTNASIMNASNGTVATETNTMKQQEQPGRDVVSQNHNIPARKSSSQYFCQVVGDHFDGASYYGIGPELIRGAVSSVVSSMVQEYFLQWASTEPQTVQLVTDTDDE